MNGNSLLSAFEQMLTIRAFEERAEQLFYQSEVRGSVHLGIGQEAVAVGARAALRAGDLVAPTYRGHAYALAWGMPVLAAFGELFGRAIGSNRGRGGSKHFADLDRGVLPGNAIVAASLPIACGTAFAARLDRREEITLVPFGEGATNQAVFHEAMNLAVLWDLPVIFLCENNLYSEMTPIARMSRNVDISERATAYPMPSAIADGMDVTAVEEAVSVAADRARRGGGPTFIEAKTYRFCGHMPGDSEPYRTKEEVAEWRKRDPIDKARRELQEAGRTSDELESISRTVSTAVMEAEGAAREAALPSVLDVGLGAADWMEVER